MKDEKYRRVRVLLIEGFTRQVLPIMKELHSLGCNITTYNNSCLDIGYVSRYPNHRLIRYCNKKDKQRTYEELKKELSSGKYDIVIPITDFAAILLSEHYDELSKYCTLAVRDWKGIQYAIDKLVTMTVCMKNDIPCPKTFTSKEEFLNSERSLQYPVVVKPRTGCAAVGFHVAESREDVLYYLSKAENKFGPCLIQEYIPQTDYQYKCEMFVGRDGEVKSSCVFAKERWYPINGGSSCLNKTVERPDIIESCKRLLIETKWEGYADVDLIQDPRDGIAKIMEINPRITGSVKICSLAGVNFSKQIIDDYLGESINPQTDYKKGVYLRYFFTDILWFVKSPNRWKAKPSFFRILPDQIFSISDPLPFFTYAIQGFFKIFSDKKRRAL